jgi:hypothetical protein
MVPGKPASRGLVGLGLLRDKTRPSRIPSVGSEVAAQVVLARRRAAFRIHREPLASGLKPRGLPGTLGAEPATLVPWAGAI